MELKEVLFKELVKKGYSELKDGRKVWDVANRSIIYMTPELVDSFLKLREHPRYQKTIVEIETELLNGNAKKLIDGHINGPFNLIDMGCTFLPDDWRIMVGRKDRMVAYTYRSCRNTLGDSCEHICRTDAIYGGT